MEALSIDVLDRILLPRGSAGIRMRAWFDLYKTDLF
jgi:hypothetical protein